MLSEGLAAKRSRLDFTPGELLALFKNPKFSGFTADQCRDCRKNVNVFSGTDCWICPCGSYNFQTKGQCKPHESPDFGPSRNEIEVVVRTLKEEQVWLLLRRQVSKAVRQNIPVRFRPGYLPGEASLSVDQIGKTKEQILDWLRKSGIDVFTISDPKGLFEETSNDPPLRSLEIGKIYRLKSNPIGGYNYTDDYREGRFIDVRVLEGPDEHGLYKVTSRGEDGNHIGSGGGWEGDSTLLVWPSALEEVF